MSSESTVDDTRFRCPNGCRGDVTRKQAHFGNQPSSK